MPLLKLTEILGYQLDMTRCAAMRSLRRRLGDGDFRPADTTALLLVREQPGCDQTVLGRALAGNRSVGMKVASRLEGRGLLMRGVGRDRRSRGLYLTPAGNAVLTDLLARHGCAESELARYLAPGEREVLLSLLHKIERGLLAEEARSVASFAAAPTVPREQEARIS